MYKYKKEILINKDMFIGLFMIE